jgi:putative cardiolipin synthase
MTALVVLWLSACSSLPPRGPVEYSVALNDTETTTLGRVAAESTSPGRSGFGLLPIGGYAFVARIALAAQAERSLDVQYYHLHSDPTSVEFLRTLRDASRRGVRVRLLVDDLHAPETYPLLSGLAAYPGVQVRLFNPLPARDGDRLSRMLWSSHEFMTVNSRMHNKLFVVDNAVAIFGGRNVADEYFMRHREANFVDLDLIAAGPVVQQLSQSFDLYWNSEHAYPLQALLPAPADPAQVRAAFERIVDVVHVRGIDQPAADPQGRAPVTVQLANGRLELHPGDAKVHADLPSKVGVAWWTTESSTALRGVAGMISSAQSEVHIVSPYFMFGNWSMSVLKDLASRKVRTSLYTNSLGSTDEPLVHVAYARYRVAYLRLGGELYEFNPDAGSYGGRFGDFGRSVARMHTKLAVADRRWVVAGSYNIDNRSGFANTELAVVIDCPALADEATQLILGEYRPGMYRLRLAKDGSTIEWLIRDADGRLTVTPEEPHQERLPTAPRLLELYVDPALL